MKNHLFDGSCVRYFEESIRGRVSDNMQELTMLQPERPENEFSNILRWEEDGGLILYESIESSVTPGSPHLPLLKELQK